MKRPEIAKVSLPNGFALIVTITLLVMLSLIALGFLSLSAVTLRGSSQSQAMEEARANARLALQVAIGELQKHTGADTRVTAMSTIVESSSPPIVGAWRSWEGLDHQRTGDLAGRPIVPNYNLKDQAFSDNDGRFLGWLISTARPGQNISDPSSLASSAPVPDPSVPGRDLTVPLLGEGSLGPNPGQIHVQPNLVETESRSGVEQVAGATAWWISPENQKARVMQAYEPRSNDDSSVAEKWQSHAVPNLQEFGLESLQTNKEGYLPNQNQASSGRKAVTLGSTQLIAAGGGTEPQLRFHDLSTTAVGLLTNTATGGWRKDLSILTEKWDQIYSRSSGGLPLFRFSPEPGDTSAVDKATPVKPTSSGISGNRTGRFTLYPWSRYSNFSQKVWPNTWHAASSSWESLKNYATLYKEFDYSSGVAEGPFFWSPVMKWRWRGSDRDATAQEFFDYQHAPRVHPIIARFQFIVYIRAFPDTRRPGRYGTELLYSPMLTMWNPYNVRLSINNPGAPVSGVVVGGKRSFPGAFTAQPIQWFSDPRAIPLDRYKMLSNGNFQYMDTNGNFGGEYDNHLQENVVLYKPNGSRADTMVDLRTWGVNLPAGSMEFEPGEVRMFSPDGDSERRFGGTAFGMKNGYQPGAPSGLPITVRRDNLAPDSFFWYVMRNESYTQPFRYRSPGRGFNLALGMNVGNSYTNGSLYSGVGQEMLSMTALTNGARARVYWPDSDYEPHGYTVEEIASVPALPLYSITVGPRFTIGAGVGSFQSRPTKGFLQTDPLAGMSLVDPGIDGPDSHPANGNFEMTYHTLSFGSSLTPNLSDREGFIITGYQSGDGISRIITHELPLRPMASLVELQAWNPRGRNPMPPYQTHLIGNSDANPMIPSDDIVPSDMTPGSPDTNLQHDDAYCSNHLLFDDFFLSSIAPQPVDFGANVSREIETVYEDFLKGDFPLTNRTYKPIGIDRNLTDGEITSLVNEIVNSPDGDGWMKVASRLEVEGMFNINSTSVDAWKALLGHARSMDGIAYHGPNGVDTLGDNDTRPHPVTRAPIAPDVEAGTNSTVGNPAGTTEVTGFRRLTDAQIADLAEKVVEQVRERGPFLSLSEFVNRQLTTNEDRALAGAIQSAINNLSDDPMSDLRDPGNFLSDTTMASKASAGSQVNSDRLAGVNYEFDEAARGSSLHGLPGWLRQADVLRPIAPILTARDDTFTIRAYGDARDPDGSIIAQAWCEATVQRQRDFVDSADPPDAADAPTSPMNQKFGRRYQIVSFRWLQEDEV